MTSITRRTFLRGAPAAAATALAACSTAPAIANSRKRLDTAIGEVIAAMEELRAGAPGWTVTLRNMNGETVRSAFIITWDSGTPDKVSHSLGGRETGGALARDGGVPARDVLKRWLANHPEAT